MRNIEKCKNTLFIAVVSAVLLVGATACSTTENTNTNTDTNSTTDQASTAATATTEPEEKEYAIGETWTVDGQWSLTIDSVSVYNDRNEFSEKNPAAVYIIDYTYTNIGYEDESGIMDGLYMDISENIIDSAGFMGYSYPGDIINYPKETPVGASCKAQVCVGVDNAGSFKLNVSQYDGNNDKQSATFNVTVQ